MKPLREFPAAARRRIRFVLCDIDDTLTSGGRLGAAAYAALEALADSGCIVVPVTGRPAGWCDLIARFWPVDAVIGENGAFYFRYDPRARRMTRRYAQDEAERAAAHQPSRIADLASDYREDCGPLPPEEAARIAALFRAAGASAKISSIHVNGWFGDYDKLAMTRLLFRDCYGGELDDLREDCVFVGDSPNDEPMFAGFPHSVGVANIRPFAAGMQTPPAYVTAAEAGAGFAEFAAFLLS